MKKTTLPLSGKLVDAVIANVCQKPIQGDDTWEHCSIGVALDSIVATDSHSAVMIGLPADLHVATQRKEALLECTRANLYGDAVRIDDVARNTDLTTGESKPMPHIQSVIQKQLGGMKPLASMNPKVLLAIAKIAAAAGARSVELYQPEGDPSTLGFQFEFAPDENMINLFSEWTGMIPARGVFSVKAANARKSDEEPELGETAEIAPRRKPKKEKEAVRLEVIENPAPLQEPTPIVIDREISALRGEFMLPPLGLLHPGATQEVVAGDYETGILEVLRASNIPARMLGYKAGPTVTMYEVDVPAGVSVKKVAALAEDLQMQLAVRSVRIQAPIPGKKAIGIELPNKQPRTVSLDEVCATADFTEGPSRLLMALGLDLAGKPVYANLASLPHLLIAGATSSGKSIGLATILSSLLMRNTPKELRLILIDPKRVELNLFAGIPHLACPVVTDVYDVPSILFSVVTEMEHRYEILEREGVRNIDGYNAKAHEDDRLSNWVVVIDELADLMMTCSEEVEPNIVRLAQKARAVGIHLILATQRPSVDVITGLIKANMPSRIAFAVATQIDSRVVIDQNGAEKLLGKGDMLFAPIDGGGRATRLQGAYVSEEELAAICGYWRKHGKPTYDFLPPEKPKKPEADEPKPKRAGAK